MENIKHCKRCGKEISNIETADWYSHIRIKYCDECRTVTNREGSAVRMHNMRQRQRQRHQARDEQLALIEEKNQLLREEIELLRAMIIEDREKRKSI